MGTKKLMVSPIEERAHGDPVALFFGYDSDVGTASVFEVDAESDDLWSFWLVQYSVINENAMTGLEIYTETSYSQVVPFGSSGPQYLMAVYKKFGLNENASCESFIKPVFLGWKKQNIKFTINVNSMLGAEESSVIYIRGLIYKEFPVNL